MELKELIIIFKKERKAFFGVFIAIITVGILYFLFQPQTFKTTLTLNVSRTGVVQTQEYDYDAFYRLQADERFADTVVRWLESPRILENIYDEAGVEKKRPIDGARLSSQVIRVTFSTSDVQSAQRIAAAVKKELNRQTDSLNVLQQQENWFVLLADAPVIESGTHSFARIVAVAAACGLFVGVWTVMGRHYMRT